MTRVEITPEMTMREILEKVPSAQRALFQKYHVGGCTSCGFQPTDTLAQVCKDHNILDVNGMIATIQRAHETDGKIRVQAADVKAWLDAGEEFSLIDVRTPDERVNARFEAAEPLDYGDSDKYMSLPKDRKLVFVCRDGQRSLDVAAYFIGHGFQYVFAIDHGLDGWRAQVDPSLTNY